MPREVDSCTLKTCLQNVTFPNFCRRFWSLYFVFSTVMKPFSLFLDVYLVVTYFYLALYHIRFSSAYYCLLSVICTEFIWDLKSCLFIQVTNLEERGRVKCYQYWPSEGGEAYGDIQVTLMQTVELSDFTIRTLCLKKANSRTERTVNQYHYTIWPDHGVPTCATSVLTFVRKASGSNPPDAGPMVSYRQIL